MFLVLLLENNDVMGDPDIVLPRALRIDLSGNYVTTNTVFNLGPP